MRASAKILAGLGAALALAACGPAEPTPASDPAPAAPAAAATNPYLNADGSVNYTALRRDYGAPNQNIILNPRATNVAATASRTHVTILPDRLVFDAKDAQWLQNARPGDTLYCNHTCGQDGFLRNITAIARVGDTWVVSTVDGQLSDVIWQGWIHTEAALVPRDAVPYSGTPAEAPGEKTTNEGTKESKFEHKWTGALSGNVTVMHQFGLKLTTDFVFHLRMPTWRNWSPVTVALIKMVVTGSLTDGVELSAKATGGYDLKYPIEPKLDIPLAVIPLDAIPPIEITPTFEMEAEAYAEATGTVALTAKADVVKKVSVGFTYSDSTGFQRVFNNPAPTCDPSISASGEAELDLGMKVTNTLAFKIESLAGPNVVLEGKVGGKVKAEVSETADPSGLKCEAKVDANLYAELSGKVGAEISIPHTPFKKSAELNLVSFEWAYPDPPWEKEIPGVCPEEEDGGEGSSSGSTGAGGSGGSGSTATGLGSTSCASNNDCYSQMGDPDAECVNGTCCDSSDTTCIQNADSGGTSGTTSSGGTNGSSSGGGACSTDADCGGGQVCCGSVCGDPCAPCGETCALYTDDPTSTCAGGSCTCTCPADSLYPGDTCASHGAADTVRVCYN